MALVERKLQTLDWKEKGMVVSGFLTSAVVVNFQDGGKGMRYMVDRGDGAVASFKGATQLDMMLSTRDLGKYVQITYLGEDETREMSQGRSRPKLFKVAVDDQRKIDVGKHLDGDPGITDADIGF